MPDGCLYLRAKEMSSLHAATGAVVVELMKPNLGTVTASFKKTPRLSLAAAFQGWRIPQTSVMIAELLHGAAGSCEGPKKFFSCCLCVMMETEGAAAGSLAHMDEIYLSAASSALAGPPQLDFSSILGRRWSLLPSHVSTGWCAWVALVCRTRVLQTPP